MNQACLLLVGCLFIFGSLFIYLSGRMAGSLCGCTGFSLVAVSELLTVVSPLVEEHRLQGTGLQQLWRAGSAAAAPEL